MNEKRFYYAHGIIFDTYKDNYINKIGTIKDLDIGLRIVNWLNELNNENEQLKQFKEDFIKILDEITITYVDLLNESWEENEQLKQFKEDVFTKIDMHLRMLPTARDNEFNGEDGDPSLYSGAIYMLETLKKELQRDD